MLYSVRSMRQKRRRSKKSNEPVIFSALNTAKVMLVLGTKPEYFNAVWVKNEWSRFLKLMKKDRSRLMIPCYKDMDPYELPDEFAHLQSQDMGKIGFINDLVRGIQKVIDPDASGNKTSAGSSPAEIGKNNTERLLERGRISLEDREWETADALFEQVLTRDVYCAAAYYGKFIAKYRISDDQSIYNYLSANCKDVQPKQLTSDIPIDFSSPSSHVMQMANRYAVPGFLAPKTIISQYKKPILYNSVLAGQIDSINSQYNIFTTDRILARAFSYADDDLKKKINALISNFQRKANDLTVLAQNEDNKIKWNSHNAFISQTDQTVIRLYYEALSTLENRYQYCIAGFENSNTGKDFKYIRSQFEYIRWYKESEAYIAGCNNLISDWNKNKKRRNFIEICAYFGWILPLLFGFLLLLTGKPPMKWLLITSIVLYVIILIIKDQTE